MSHKTLSKQKTRAEIIDEKFTSLFMPEDELIQRGLKALNKELGVVEAGRFISRLINTKPGDSVRESRERYKNETIESIMTRVNAALSPASGRAARSRSAKSGKP